MTDPYLMKGPGWQRCCICGELHEHPYPGLARDPYDDSIWDVCAGRCAVEAGIEPERRSLRFLRFLERFKLIKIHAIHGKKKK